MVYGEKKKEQNNPMAMLRVTTPMWPLGTLRPLLAPLPVVRGICGISIRRATEKWITVWNIQSLSSFCIDPLLTASLTAAKVLVRGHRNRPCNCRCSYRCRRVTVCSETRVDAMRIVLKIIVPVTVDLV